MSRGSRSSVRFAVVAGLLLLSCGASLVVAVQAKRDFTVSARKYAYRVSGNDAAEIHVQQDDLVRITFSAEDIPHSFSIDDDHYRISRRAEPGQPVVFEFRADKPGRFEIRCKLTMDERCREMLGWLVVSAR